MEQTYGVHIKGTFAEIVKKVRGYLGVTQEELAILLKISPATIVRWENGKGKPSFLLKQFFERFCDEAGFVLEEIQYV